MRFKTPPAPTLTWWYSPLKPVLLSLHPPLVLSVKTTLRLTSSTMALEGCSRLVFVSKNHCRCQFASCFSWLSVLFAEAPPPLRVRRGAAGLEVTAVPVSHQLSGLHRTLASRARPPRPFRLRRQLAPCQERRQLAWSGVWAAGFRVPTAGFRVWPSRLGNFWTDPLWATDTVYLNGVG